jgi:hypothetical protein
LSFQRVEKQIINRLAQKGFKNVSFSSTWKTVQKFEQNEYSQSIFQTIRSRPFLRVLLHLITQEKLPITKDQVQQLLEENTDRLKKVLKGPLDRNLLCRSCSEVIRRYNVYNDDKPSGKMKCPKCNSPNELSQCKESDDWSFPRISIASYLDCLLKTRMLISKIMGNCNRCMRSDSFEQIPLNDLNSLAKQRLMTYVKKIYCKQCGNFYDLTEIYNLEDIMVPLWNRNGIWLEWYVKNIVEEHFPNSPVQQGLVVRNGEVIEVDVMLLNAGKLVSFECKALSIGKNASFNEVSEALKPLDFSDEVILVTTSTLKENDKRILLNRGDGKLKVVEAYDIENLVSFIKK